LQDPNADNIRVAVPDKVWLHISVPWGPWIWQELLWSYKPLNPAEAQFQRTATRRTPRSI